MSLTLSLKIYPLLLGGALIAAAAPAPAATKIVSPPQAETAATPEVSAARRHYRRAYRRGYAYPYVRRGYAYPGYYGRNYYGAAPSFGFIGGPDGYPGEYAWRRSIGQCVHDLGYGRWKGC